MITKRPFKALAEQGAAQIDLFSKAAEFDGLGSSTVLSRFELWTRMKLEPLAVSSIYS